MNALTGLVKAVDHRLDSNESMKAQITQSSRSLMLQRIDDVERSHRVHSTITAILLESFRHIHICL
jgi:hypothetical protein